MIDWHEVTKALCTWTVILVLVVIYQYSPLLAADFVFLALVALLFYFKGE